MKINKLRTLIKKKINVEYIDIEDLTFGHKNHKKSNDGMHLKLKIVSDDFKNIPLIDRHRMIYKIVGEFLRKEIHALSISSYTILEYKKKSQ